MQVNDQELETAKVKEQLMSHAHLVEQYEARFTQVREIIDSREKEYVRKVADMQIIIEDQNTKIDKQQRVIEQLELDRGEALTQLKDARWSQDQQSKRLQRDLAKIRDQADGELADKDKLIDKLRAEAQQLL